MRWLGAVLFLIAASGAIAGAPTLDLRAIAGIYRHPFANSMADGEPYRSEDTLEIVRRNRTQAFFRLHLEFRNGHSCDALGIADVRDDALVYDSDKMDDGRPCVLTLTATPDRLVIADKGRVCQLQMCGMRGIFDGATFDRALRKPIRDLRKLTRSRDFTGAVAEHDTAHPH